MRVVNVRDLKELKLYNYGNYSWIKLVELDGKKYCYKEFKKMYNDDTFISRLCDFTDITFPDFLLMPLFMVERGSIFSGYLTSYDENYVDLDDPFTKKEQLLLMKSGVENLKALHNDFKLIHGDMHFSNLKIHKEKLESHLLDFDFTYKFGDVPSDFSDFGIAVNNYLKYYPYDKNVDIYYYNLATFLFLSKIDSSYKIILRKIMNGDYYIENENNDVKRLIKELTLEDTKKPYSGEFIVDYL